MKAITPLLSFIVMTSTFAKTNFGTEITLKDPLTLKEAISKIDEKKTNTILVSAKVGKVCKSKGCWMTLEDKSGNVRVTFKDYSFFVPFSLIGKSVLIQGKLESYKMSVKEAKHIAEDAGKSSEKITKPVTEYRMIASGVKVI